MNRDADPVPAEQLSKIERRSVTDSPWFWALMFSSMAWVALLAMDHKFGRRQAQVEHRFQARAYSERQASQPRAAQADEQEADYDVNYSAAEQTVISLWPLRLVALLVMCFSAIALVRARLAGSRDAAGGSIATVPTKGSQ